MAILQIFTVLIERRYILFLTLKNIYNRFHIEPGMHFHSILHGKGLLKRCLNKNLCNILKEFAIIPLTTV